MPKNQGPQTIVTDHKKNFDTLCKVFEDKSQCLLDCILKSTGEHVAVIAACVHHEPNEKGEEYTFTPFAMFFNGNPYQMLVSPADPEYETFKPAPSIEM